jgi:hypothetical protein
MAKCATPTSVAFARVWKGAVNAARPDLRVRLNYPYAGKGDGLTNYLRRCHSPDQYIGIEFELNQRHVDAAGAALKRLRKHVVQSLETAMAAFTANASDP